MGKIGFFSSWASRRAISRQAATRSACSTRSRDAASSAVMLSNLALTGAAMRADRSDAAASAPARATRPR